MAVIPFTTVQVPNGLLYTWVNLRDGDSGSPVEVYTWPYRSLTAIPLGPSIGGAVIQAGNDGTTWIQSPVLGPAALLPMAEWRFRYIRPFHSHPQPVATYNDGITVTLFVCTLLP